MRPPGFDRAYASQPLFCWRWRRSTACGMSREMDSSSRDRLPPSELSGPTNLTAWGATSWTGAQKTPSPGRWLFRRGDRPISGSRRGLYRSGRRIRVDRGLRPDLPAADVDARESCGGASSADRPQPGGAWASLAHASAFWSGTGRPPADSLSKPSASIPTVSKPGIGMRSGS